jgi:hypothetical protein
MLSGLISLKFNGVFMYQSQYIGNVHIGYRAMGQVIVNDDGLKIIKSSGEFSRATNFGKVDGVDLIEEI